MSKVTEFLDTGVAQALGALPMGESDMLGFTRLAEASLDQAEACVLPTETAAEDALMELLLKLSSGVRRLAARIGSDAEDGKRE